MTLKQKEIIIKFLSWFLSLFLIIFVGVNNVFGATISDYATKYYYYSANDNSSTDSTAYRSGDSNYVTLFAAEPPTYDNGEGFNGFYNRVNYSIVKGNIYTLSLVLSYSNLLDSEFSRNDMTNRLFTTTFAHCSACSISSVSGTYRRYSNTSGANSNTYDFSVHMSYTFVATSTTNQFYIGSYTGDDRVLGVDNHLYTSIVSVTGLTIEENNSSTIINQNDTIINQNQQIIEQNEQNTQDIIDNQNQNAQDIINNQNSNTQQQIESQQVCNDIIISYSDAQTTGTLDSSGGIVSSNANWKVTDFIDIHNISSINLTNILYAASVHFCFYNSNKGLINCLPTITSNSNPSIPNNAYYARFSIRNSNQPQVVLSSCKNGNQALDDSINNLNDTISDSSSPNVDSLNNMAGWLPAGPVDSILNLPLTFFNTLNNVLSSSTCQSVSIPLPFVNDNLSLPCFSSFMSQYLPNFNTLWTFIGGIVSVLILYSYLLNLYKWVDDTLTFRENNHIDNWGGV